MRISAPLAAALSLALLAALLGPAPATAGEPQVLSDEWNEVRIGGARTGWSHSVVRRVEAEDGPRIETEETTQIEMARMGQKIRIEESSTTVERPDGTLISIRKASKQSSAETIVEVTVAGEKAKVATTSMGTTREAEVAVPQGTVGPHRAERIVAEGGSAPGTTHVLKLFLTDLGGPVVATSVVVGPESVEDIDGKATTLTRVDATMDKMPIKTSAWMTAEGKAVRTRVEMMGMVIESLRCSRERALGEGASEEPPVEVFTSSLIRTDALIPHARTLDSALLALRSRREGAKLDSLFDERQKVESREEDGTLLLRVVRQVPAEGATGRRPLADPPAEMAKYLAATSMLQADDPMIRKATEEAVGAQTDAWKASQAIERWVHGAIAKKGMGVAFASALEVCRDREGDCTEHAVLMAAMCRAAGIPSRVAMGLVYVTGIFGGHAWTEVWIQGRWYGLDATMGSGHLDPLHLTMGRMAFEEGTHGAEFGGFMDAMSGLEIEVREVVWRGRRVPLVGADAVIEDGARFVDRGWGLAFCAPEGYAIAPRPGDAGMSPLLAKVDPADDDRGSFVVIADSLARSGDIEAYAAAFGGSGSLAEFEIDGRKGKVGRAGGKDEGPLVAIVTDDGDSVFLFVFKTGEGDDEATFSALLESVDLDAEETAAPAGR